MGTKSQHAVAIVGGATAGAEAASILAGRGVLCVVFEQNQRPYGKIEDGLPRWHVKLRRKEYETIDGHLSKEGIHFVPSTKIGRDVRLRELVDEWGFNAVLLAHGAWRDRSLPIKGADAYVGRGLIYQNSFIYWFNHYPEAGYKGPRYEISDGAIVVGGGLASLDVLKALQIETVRRALAKRGIEEDVLHLEHTGIAAALEAHGLRWDDLGIKPATLYYRRRIEDMPLADVPEGADEKRTQQFEAVRRKILEKAMQKYGFSVRPLMLPMGLIIEGDRLVGLRFQHTRVEKGVAVPIEGEYEDVISPLIISSIGSIPEPMEGIVQHGQMYHYTDPDLGRIEGFDTVFSAGNVVTGKGNILDSRKHSVRVSKHVAEEFLGLSESGSHAGEEELLEVATAEARSQATQIADAVAKQPPLDAARLERLLAKVRERQHAVGLDGTYREWIARVTPADMA